MNLLSAGGAETGPPGSSVAQCERQRVAHVDGRRHPIGGQQSVDLRKVIEQAPLAGSPHRQVGFLGRPVRRPGHLAYSGASVHDLRLRAAHPGVRRDHGQRDARDRDRRLQDHDVRAHDRDCRLAGLRQTVEGDLHRQLFGTTIHRSDGTAENGVTSQLALPRRRRR